MTITSDTKQADQQISDTYLGLITIITQSQVVNATPYWNLWDYYNMLQKNRLVLKCNLIRLITADQ